jgi:hypothetical protein
MTAPNYYPAAITGALNDLKSFSGSLNHATFTAAARLHSLALAGALSPEDADALVMTAAADLGLPRDETISCIKSGRKRATVPANLSARPDDHWSGRTPVAGQSPLAAPQPAATGWLRAATAFHRLTFRNLWREPVSKPVAWLTKRYGLTEDTIALAGLGYNSIDRHMPRSRWGLLPTEDGKTSIWLPRGIVIPWRTGITQRGGMTNYSQVIPHKLEIRRPIDDARERWEAVYPAPETPLRQSWGRTYSVIREACRDRARFPYGVRNDYIDKIVLASPDFQDIDIYALEELEKAGYIRHPRKLITVSGSENFPYNIDAVTSDKPVLLCEGVMNALAVQQEAGDLVTPVALGSTTGARAWQWVLRLALAPVVLVAFDADTAGGDAAMWWIQALDGKGHRHIPDSDDPAAMLVKQGGYRLREWVAQGVTG